MAKKLRFSTLYESYRVGHEMEMNRKSYRNGRQNEGRGETSVKELKKVKKEPEKRRKRTKQEQTPG